MKIALCSFGFLDSVIPLFRHLKEEDSNIDLFLIFSLNRKQDSIINFENVDVTTGFTAPFKKVEIIPNEIKKYLGDISRLHLFIYHNLKFRSFRNLMLTIRLARRLRTYDIVHFNGSNGVLPILLVLLFGKKIVFTIHDFHSHSGEESKFRFSERLNRFIVCSKYPVIIQNRKDFKSVLRAYPKAKKSIHYIPFGVLDIYRQFRSSREKQSRFDVLFFGRILPYKGVQYLIEAVKLLNLKEIRVKTVIAGQGYLDDTANRMKDVRILNRYITNMELADLLLRTKLVVCPYTDATQSGVLMTAFAFHKPVIASAVGVFPEIIQTEYNGILVPPKDPVSLAKALRSLLEDPAKRRRFQKRIIQFKDSSPDYSWYRITRKYRNLYGTI